MKFTYHELCYQFVWNYFSIHGKWQYTQYLTIPSFPRSLFYGGSAVLKKLATSISWDHKSKSLVMLHVSLWGKHQTVKDKLFLFQNNILGFLVPVIWWIGICSPGKLGASTTLTRRVTLTYVWGLWFKLAVSLLEGCVRLGWDDCCLILVALSWCVHDLQCHVGKGVL